MNLLRGILSIGIIISCLLNWVEIEAENLMLFFSGLTWIPSTILLYASVLTAGYSFYNSYRNSNVNSWIYLTCGLYGIGMTIYIYQAVTRRLDLIYTLAPANATNEVAFHFGLGIYLTGLLSLLLFLTGFDKSDNKAQVTTFDQHNSSMGQQSNVQSNGQENLDKPNFQDWLKENPGKSLNDYFSKNE